MIIGVPKEIKNHENRVALTPAGAHELIQNGHEVIIEKDAGVASGFSNEKYEQLGVKLVPTHDAVFEKAELIVKVKEPIKQEYDLIKDHHTVFAYFHFASEEELTKAMIRSKAVCIAYETVQRENGSLPLLIPMSEVAGRMSIQQGAKYLEKPMGGKGVLLGGVPGVKPAKVMILGGGIVGTEAAKMAAGLGADVSILDISLPRLRQLSNILPSNVKTIRSNMQIIEEMVQNHDLIIGAVLIPGAKAPKLITKEMLKLMQPGTVIVDVAVDQGGCFETTRPTTHENPVYVQDGVVHYSVTNMPGAVPYTSTVALTNATLPFLVELANKGWKQSCIDNSALGSGLNIVSGQITYEAVSHAFGLPFISIDTIL